MRHLFSCLFMFSFIGLGAQETEKDKIIYDDSITIENQENGLKWQKDSTARQEIKDVLKEQNKSKEAPIPVNKKNCRLETLLVIRESETNS